MTSVIDSGPGESGHRSVTEHATQHSFTQPRAQSGQDAPGHSTHAAIDEQTVGSNALGHEAVQQHSPQSLDLPQLVSLTQALERVEDAVRTRLAEADRSGKVIDWLESEARRLKHREDEKRLEPIIRAIISLFDDIARVASEADARQRSAGYAEHGLVQTIVVFKRQVLELLNRAGVTEFTPEPGDKFDAKRQEVISTVETTTQEKHLIVDSVLRLGFEFAGRVVRPAAVQVFKYSADSPLQPTRPKEA